MLILITGGSKNGKSHIAENIITSYDCRKFYIATMQPYCDDAFEAIERHRRIRAGKGFETIEKYVSIGEIQLNEKCAVLLECVCNLCANEMFTAKCESPVRKIISDIDKLHEKAEILVLVTNQVGEDGIQYPPETMEYIKNMGEINSILAEKSDCVIEAVYGIPVILKGEKLPCIY
jgi:adenosylcobinamide kinase/adenosylcobinamide-phosphate guanylyltransferase